MSWLYRETETMKVQLTAQAYHIPYKGSRIPLNLTNVTQCIFSFPTVWYDVVGRLVGLQNTLLQKRAERVARGPVLTPAQCLL